MVLINKIRRRCKKWLKRMQKPVPVPVPVFQNELLKGRRALVTGGSSGIGLAMAKAFVRSGASVIITGRDRDRLMHAANLIGDSKVVKVCVLDNTAPESFDQALLDCGVFDILVNNAGYVGGSGFGNATVLEYDKVLDTNLRGPFFLSQAVARQWIDNGIQGNILNICSASSLRPGNSPYILSKWGMRSLTVGMAKKLIPHGIVVNGLAPGCTNTEKFCDDVREGIENSKNPAGRMVTVDEVANMAVVLVSSLARMVVGDVVYMTGGGAITTFEDC